MQLKRITLCVALTLAPNVYAEEAASLPEIEVKAAKLQSTGVDEIALPRQHIGSSDTARLLEDQLGVSLYRAGGVSSLPVIHGLADDRVRVKVDGMDLISACANHMNAPLSYIDPAHVGSVKVWAGITPVSVGGDSIAGTVQVDSAAPQFAKNGDGTLLQGEAGAFYRSNNAAQGGHLNATIAGEDVSVRYSGATVRAKNYRAGGNFKNSGVSAGTIGNVYVAGNEVASTQYQSSNQSVAFGLRRDNHLFELKLGLQNIPYQGFANQRMDMLKNNSEQINLNYTGQYGWGVLQARAYNEHTRHYMNFLEDKTVAMMPAGMPMDTSGQNSGWVMKGELALNERDLLRLGAEYQRYRMSDWWSPTGPVVGMMAMNNMMTGGNFLNINKGQRDRLGVFGEWEARWSPQWQSQLGLRYEAVKMDTGAVQGYNTLAYPAVSYAAFNAASRARNDGNLDLTALASYTPDERKTFEIGFAQKTRSPNLYERYTWSTNNSMAMTMNTWFGDGNGYVGNLNLKPEVARTVSGSFSLHDADMQGFELKLSPYYTHVQNYIDAVNCAAVGLVCPAPSAGFLNLSLANQSARLYGTDIKLRAPLLQGYGDFVFTGVLNYVNGKNLTTGDNLYHIMPLNAKLSVEQRRGDWTNTVEAKLVSAHRNVQAARNELKSGGYSLLNLRSSYEWKKLRFDVGIENLLNKFYVDPLGGSYLGQRPVVAGVGVPGMGRSINAGLTVKF